VQKLRKRLSGYWKMEAGCAVAFPLLTIAFVEVQSTLDVVGLTVSLLACCSLLAIGAAYWRAALHRIDGSLRLMSGVLRVADKLQQLLLVLSVASAALGIYLLASDPHGLAARVCVGLSTLALLEYVNYFHVQLQNFDSLSDFQRLLRERRFRRSHLAVDLSASRTRRRLA
jgi:hypothetical protein